MSRELTAEQVRKHSDPALFDCESTAELAPSEGIIGQERAMSALHFGLNVNKRGFNVFVSGSSGTGRTTATKAFVEMLAAQKPTPSDWCYVHNFRDAYYPEALRLPAGMGQAFQKDMKRAVENAKKGLIQAFASKEYAQRRSDATEDFNRRRTTAFETLSQKARDRGLLLQNTSVGLVFVPAADGEAMSEEQYRALSVEQKDELRKRQEELTRQLKEEINHWRVEEEAVEKQLEETDREVARYSINHLFEDLKTKYKALQEVVDYLKDVEQDIIDNYQQLRAEPKTSEMSPTTAIQEMARREALAKYEVNLLVDNSQVKGAPVILELNPSFNNLFGRIEKEAVFGALHTDFTMIKSGSMHRANGGFLVLRIEDLLSNLISWETLKRTLRDGKLIVEELSERLGFVAMKSLRPEPIPLDIKVVIIGEPLFYYLLLQADIEFKELFKVRADFDSRMDKSEAYIRDYAAVICRMCRQEALRNVKSGALAKIIEHSSRMAGDQEKLSTLFAEIADIIREADFWAGQSGAEFVEAEHVQKAIEQKVYRSNLIQQRINEAIQNGTIIIDTEGVRVGQVNGLSVIDLGDFAFGRPTRITATVGVGREGVVDIEREARLGGRLHTKGVMILSGYLTEQYAREMPLSLASRLVFEQSYEEIEGDSASSAELYTLLSRLADVPVKQSIAVTGSVNQKGEVQAIGGVNEKIEGFFEVCRLKGLDGSQGVMIPTSNVRHLMLKEDVVEAIRAGQFHVYTAGSIDEGIEVLTGVKSGQRLPDGSFEPDSVHDKVQKQLKTLAEKLRGFSRPETSAPAAEHKNNEAQA